jgi:hypothetical protein
MKIIFLTHFSDQGHRFRVEQYFPFLKAHQIEPKWQPTSGTLRERLVLYQELPSYEVVCIQRRLFSPYEFYRIRQRSNKVLFDLDDAIMYRPPVLHALFLPGGSNLDGWSGEVMYHCGNQSLRKQVLREAGRRLSVPPVSIRVLPERGVRSSLGWIDEGNLKYLNKNLSSKPLA